MIRHPMKPETRERRRLAYEESRRRDRRVLRARLEEKTAEEGPESIWAELLREHIEDWGKELP